MARCPTCGTDLSHRYQLGGLVVYDDQPYATWQGRLLDLSPHGTRLLAELLKAPIVHSVTLQHVFERPISKESLRVTLHRLRKAVPLEIEIIAMKGEGYFISVAGQRVQGS